MEDGHRDACQRGTVLGIESVIGRKLFQTRPSSKPFHLSICAINPLTMGHSRGCLQTALELFDPVGTLRLSAFRAWHWCGCSDTRQ